MRMWRLWNLIMDLLYFAGIIIGYIVIFGLFKAFMPLYFTVIFSLCVLAGVVLAIHGIRVNLRDKRIDEELEAISRHRSKRLHR